jgi:hypothetical protein
MKAIAASLLILSTVLSVDFALGASSPNRPPGVAERDWVQMSDKMGFVVTTPRVFPMPMPDRQVLFLTVPAEGYFMVHTGHTWQRIIIQDPIKGPGASG